VLAAVAVPSLAGCGSSHSSAPSLQVVGETSLRPGQGALVRPLPRHWAISFQVRFAGHRDALKVGLGSSVVTIFDGGHGWHHARLTERMLTVDGRRSALAAGGASSVSLRATGGPARLRRLRITSR
jgi:hypothetical protein